MTELLVALFPIIMRSDRILREPGASSMEVPDRPGLAYSGLGPLVLALAWQQGLTRACQFRAGTTGHDRNWHDRGTTEHVSVVRRSQGPRHRSDPVVPDLEWEINRSGPGVPSCRGSEARGTTDQARYIVSWNR